MKGLCSGCGSTFDRSPVDIARNRHRCPSCVKAWRKAYRAARRAQGRPIKDNKKHPVKMPRSWHRDYEREYNQRPDVKQRKLQKRMSDPKYAARYALRAAVRDGSIVRQPCEVCGARPAEAHHHDYSKPFDVQWLCQEHHRALHVKLKEEAPTSSDFNTQDQSERLCQSLRSDFATGGV